MSISHNNRQLTNQKPVLKPISPTTSKLKNNNENLITIKIVQQYHFVAILYTQNVKNRVNNYSIQLYSSQLQHIDVNNTISHGKTGKQRAKVRKTFGRLRSEIR